MANKDIDTLLKEIEEKKKKLLKKKYDTRTKPINDILKKHLDKISDEEILYVANYLMDIVDSKNTNNNENTKTIEE